MAEAKHRPVSAEARGKWRQFRRHLAAECVQINSALGNARLRSLVSAYLRPGTVGREKIAHRMSTLFGPDARLEYRTRELLCWGFLKARLRVIINNEDDDPGLGQDAVCLHYLLIGRLVEAEPGKCYRADGLWSLEVTEHAGGRLFEYNRGADPAAIIWEAHSRVLQVSAAALAPCCVDPARRFLLPAGGGWFLCQLVSGEDMSASGALSVHVRARTWLSQDMAINERAIVGPGPPGEQVGDGFLLPRPLRRLVSRPLANGGVELYVEAWRSDGRRGASGSIRP
jgi:hypothetical protein